MSGKAKTISRLAVVVLLNMYSIWLVGQITADRPVSALPDAPFQTNEKQVFLSTADSDYYLLARLISAESSSEPYSGQVAVGAVVLNRVRHGSFPSSITGVIYQSGAFDCVSDGRIDVPAGYLAQRAAKEALNGLDPSGGALYYYNRSKLKSRNAVENSAVKIIGSRIFCKQAAVY